DPDLTLESPGNPSAHGGGPAERAVDRIFHAGQRAARLPDTAVHRPGAARGGDAGGRLPASARRAGAGAGARSGDGGGKLGEGVGRAPPRSSRSGRSATAGGSSASALSPPFSPGASAPSATASIWRRSPGRRVGPSRSSRVQ